jgi:hypothetical protein
MTPEDATSYLVILFGVLWIAIAIKEYRSGFGSGFGSGYENVAIAIALGLCGACLALFVLAFAALFVVSIIEIAP